MAVLSREAIESALETLDWHLEGDVLEKVVRRGDFKEALAYVNTVGQIAEQLEHHPDISLSWNEVTLRLTTHSEGGITERDLACARAIDAIS